jgi:hypothetical protein
MAIATIHEARLVLSDETRLLFDAIFQHAEGYEGLADTAARKEIRKALLVNKAIQQVLDDPPAIRPSSC